MDRQIQIAIDSQVQEESLGFPFEKLLNDTIAAFCSGISEVSEIRQIESKIDDMLSSFSGTDVDDAARFAIRTGKCSAQQLEKNLNYSHKKALNVMECLKALHIVGEGRGILAGETLVTIEEYGCIQRQVTHSTPQTIKNIDYTKMKETPIKKAPEKEPTTKKSYVLTPQPQQDLEGFYLRTTYKDVVIEKKFELFGQNMKCTIPVMVEYLTGITIRGASKWRGECHVDLIYSQSLSPNWIENRYVTSDLQRRAIESMKQTISSYIRDNVMSIPFEQCDLQGMRRFFESIARDLGITINYQGV